MFAKSSAPIGDWNCFVRGHKQPSDRGSDAVAVRRGPGKKKPGCFTGLRPRYYEIQLAGAGRYGGGKLTGASSQALAEHKVPFPSQDGGHEKAPA